MATVRVHFPRSLAEKFVRRARAIFPVEYFVYLLGRETQKGWTVHEVVWPEDGDLIQDPGGNYVAPRAQFVDRTWTIAKALGLDLIGDLHSHCYYVEEMAHSDAVPSLKDFERWVGKPSNHPLKIFGICELRTVGDGRIRRKITFWRAEPPLSLRLK